MAQKKIFLIGNNEYLFKEEIVEYRYYPGFALCQKQKCIESLHNEIKKIYPDKNILEISSKSQEELGVKLSAFNLKYQYGDKCLPVECVYQGGKVFENGGPYLDILEKSPMKAKKDTRIKESGRIVEYRLGEELFSVDPQYYFYDWIYINALHNNPLLVDKLKKYEIFTDIVFNHRKSNNCQARSVAIYLTLLKRGQLDLVLNRKIDFKRLYSNDYTEVM